GIAFEVERHRPFSEIVVEYRDEERGLVEDRVEVVVTGLRGDAVWQTDVREADAEEVRSRPFPRASDRLHFKLVAKAPLDENLETEAVLKLGRNRVEEMSGRLDVNLGVVAEEGVSRGPVVTAEA